MLTSKKFSVVRLELGKMEYIFQALERYGAFRGDYFMALYDYNLPMGDKPKKEITPGKRRHGFG